MYDPYKALAQALTHPVTLEQGLEGLAIYLRGGCEIDDDGQLVNLRETVDRSGGLTFHIYAEEHNPPHFHVKTAEFEASFLIKDGTLLKGSLPPNPYRKVQKWWKVNKPLLNTKWSQVVITQQDYEQNPAGTGKSLRKTFE